MVLSAYGHKAYVEASYEEGWMTYYFHCIDIPKESYKTCAHIDDTLTSILYEGADWLKTLPPAEQALSDEAFEVGIIPL